MTSPCPPSPLAVPAALTPCGASVESTSAHHNSGKKNKRNFADCMFHLSKWMSAQGNAFRCDSRGFEAWCSFWSLQCALCGRRQQLRSGRSRWEIGWSVTNYLRALTAGHPALLSWARTSAPLALCPSYSSLLKQPPEQIPFNLSFQNLPESRETPGWLLNTKYSLVYEATSAVCQLQELTTGNGPILADHQLLPSKVKNTVTSIPGRKGHAAMKPLGLHRMRSFVWRQLRNHANIAYAVIS